MTTRNCQHCANQITQPWTLCETCRHDYGKTLHQLRVNLRRLQQMARREYKLTNTISHAKQADAPTLIILPLQDLIDQIEDQLQDTCIDAGWTWLDDWAHLIPRMQVKLNTLCQASHAGYHLQQLQRSSQHIQQLTDRQPRKRRIIGICPECSSEITAAPGETWRICKHCGHLISIPVLRANMAEQVDQYHLTRTPAGLSQWLRDEYGYKISRKQISHWIERNKLPSTKPVSDGYYEFSIREVLTMAIAFSKRE